MAVSSYTPPLLIAEGHLEVCFLAKRNGGLDYSKPPKKSAVQESVQNPLPVSGFFLFPAVEADVWICKLVSFHKEQNPPDQLRDIDRGGDIVVHALMPVFIFRGKVVVLGEDKERQKPDRGILHLEHPRHPPQRMKQLHCCTVRQFHITQNQFYFLILKNPALAVVRQSFIYFVSFLQH